MLGYALEVAVLLSTSLDLPLWPASGLQCARPLLDYGWEVMVVLAKPIWHKVGYKMQGIVKTCMTNGEMPVWMVLNLQQKLVLLVPNDESMATALKQGHRPAFDNGCPFSPPSSCTVHTVQGF